jgi:hypothetical protein
VTAPLAFVRFRRGVVGEARRSVHLVTLPRAVGKPSSIGEFAGVLTALCGQTFSPGEAEVLPGLGGMPCGNCLRLSPGPEDPGGGKGVDRPERGAVAA